MYTLQSLLRRISTGLIDLVYPPTCLACGEPEIPCSPKHLCASCEPPLRKARAVPGCSRCGMAIAPYAENATGCWHCHDKKIRISGMVRVAPYEANIAHILHSYKYRGREEIEPLLCDWLAEAVLEATWVNEIEAIVSVPTHWLHRVRRPLHAARQLADGLAVRCNRPHAPILQRIRAGRHQVNLPEIERRKNVKNAFALRDGVTLNDAKVLIVDDVRTTGATMEECANVLLKAGAKRVYGAVLLKAQVGEDVPTF